MHAHDTHHTPTCPHIHMPIQSDNHFHTATASVQANTLLFVACSAASFLFPSWRAVSLNVNTIATFVFMNSQSKSNSCVNKCLLSHCRFRLLSGEAFTILISAAFLQIHLYIARLFKFTRGLSEGFPRGHSVSLSLSLFLYVGLGCRGPPLSLFVHRMARSAAVSLGLAVCHCSATACSHFELYFHTGQAGRRVCCWFACIL